MYYTDEEKELMKDNNHLKTNWGNIYIGFGIITLVLFLLAAFLGTYCA